MKTILAATDFTLAGQNACTYAASLARAFNARLVLFSAYQQLPFPATEVPLVVTVGDIKAAAELSLARAAESVMLSHVDVKTETMCREGAPVNEIIDAARQVNADIIVAGMKDEGKGIRRIFGSTVTALMNKSELPVIVVPENAGFVKLDTIALANDRDTDHETDPHLLDMLVELGERFKSKLYLVRIARNEFQGSYEVFNRPLRIIRMVRSLEPVYECLEGSDEERALKEFVRKYDVDMLVLLPHHHTLFDRLFARSTTRSMVFDTEVPLLILPGLRMQEEN